jgi:hypothetical protein
MKLNETDYSQILSGGYSISENQIKMIFGNNTVTGDIEDESINFPDFNTWQRVWLDLMIDRIASNGDYIYAITNKNGVFLSSNGGVDWKAVNFGLKYEYRMDHGVNIEFKDGYVFAGSNWGGIYLSANNGLNWEKVSDTPSSQIEIIGNTVISTDGYYGIQISTDNGRTWKTVYSNLLDKNIWALTSFGNKLYAGTSEGRIYLSVDYGKTLTSIASFRSGIMSLVIDGDNIFAGTQGAGIAFSSNNGLNWKTLASGTGLYVNAMAKKGDILVANGEDGILFSNDNGNNWKTIYKGGFRIDDLQVTENYIYAGTVFGILRLPIPLIYLPNSTFTLYH